jgi:hypothetical protein
VKAPAAPKKVKKQEVVVVESSTTTAEPAEPAAAAVVAGIVESSSSSSSQNATAVVLDFESANDVIEVDVAKKSGAKPIPRAKKATTSSDTGDAMPKKASKPRGKKAAAGESAVVVAEGEPEASASTEVVASKKGGRGKKAEAAAVGEKSSTTEVAASKKGSKPRAKKVAAAGGAEAETSSGEVECVSENVTHTQVEDENVASSDVKSGETEETVMMSPPAAAAAASEAEAEAEVAVVEVVVESEGEEEETEIEVTELEYNGCLYLRAKNNTLYDPETSEVVGVWNEETKSIDIE